MPVYLEELGFSRGHRRLLTIDRQEEEIFQIFPDTNKLDKIDNGKTLSQSGKEIYAASAIGTDSYAIDLNPPIIQYEVGMVLNFKADVVNTGAATLNVNSLGAKTIKKHNDQDLINGDIEANQLITVIYDGTNFQMQSQSGGTPLETSTLSSGVFADQTNITTDTNVDLTVNSLTDTPKRIMVNGRLLATGQATNRQLVFWALWGATGNPAGGFWIRGDGTMATYSSSDALKSAAVTITGTGVWINTVTLTINSITATGFVIRIAVSSGGTGDNGSGAFNLAWQTW